ncbi:transketolase subunit A [Haloactinopolyspora alba]|uniref:Transketolase subunit A n=1 Tax=Haloactinopolyspora alba TaxID=648780 RepID=A0A2P8DT10_9ACTN|nr:transketolase [Haloactinopolyspora alba]PSL00354.1 transketolase subunit A [Haloactinopolyspora alba]
MTGVQTKAGTDEAFPLFGRIGADAGREAVLAHLAEAARTVRRRDIQVVHDAGQGHIGGEFSVIDLLVTLYMHVMNVSPELLDAPERDRLILSKGHAAAALYTVLAARGYIGRDELKTFVQPLSRLNGHPARTKIDAVEASTGPLGHGLPIAVGTAVAAKLDRSERRTFVILGDGELQEGSNWEAFMTAGNQRLDRLVAVVDRNRLQQGADVAQTNDLEPLADKLRAFGWDVHEVDGHDHGALIDTFAGVPALSGRPTFVIAHTDKGYPVSYMRDQVSWHHKVPTAEHVRIALDELGNQ